MSATGEVTKLLAALKNGDAHAEAKLVALVYRELHGLAQLYMRRERPDHTLQPTALVNEAYLRLMGQNPGDIRFWTSLWVQWARE